MAQTFSIKQTGVPLGAALAGALLPLIAVSFGWRAAIWLVAVTGVLIALAAQPTRSALDAGRQREHRVSLNRLFAPLKVVAASPKLVELTLTAFVYAATQACLLGFLVIYMYQELDRTLISAGAMSKAQAGPVVNAMPSAQTSVQTWDTRIGP
jgi:MFS family permease